MILNQSIEIRLLTNTDIPLAMRLKESAGWNQTEEDWRRLLELEPDGCFAALLDGEFVGTTTSTTYGSDLGWIGMVLVNPASRRLGVATALLKTVLDFLWKRVATIKLDATSEGRHVYERLGFEVESLIERWAGISAAREVQASDKSALDVSRDDLLTFDRRAFVADRSRLIAALLDQSKFEPVYSHSSNGRLSGYAMARPGSVANYIGPVVATDEDDAKKLLDNGLSQMSGKPVYIDLNAAFSNGRQLLMDRGFQKQRNLLRMSCGRTTEKTSSLVFAIAGPEVG